MPEDSVGIVFLTVSVQKRVKRCMCRWNWKSLLDILMLTGSMGVRCFSNSSVCLHRPNNRIDRDKVVKKQQAKDIESRKLRTCVSHKKVHEQHQHRTSWYVFCLSHRVIALEWTGGHKWPMRSWDSNKSQRNNCVEINKEKYQLPIR